MVDEQKLTRLFKTPKVSKADQESRGKIYRAGKVFARAVAKEGGSSDAVFTKIKEAVLLAIDGAQRS